MEEARGDAGMSRIEELLRTGSTTRIRSRCGIRSGAGLRDRCLRPRARSQVLPDRHLQARRRGRADAGLVRPRSTQGACTSAPVRRWQGAPDPEQPARAGRPLHRARQAARTVRRGHRASSFRRRNGARGGRRSSPTTASAGASTRAAPSHSAATDPVRRGGAFSRVHRHRASTIHELNEAIARDVTPALHRARLHSDARVGAQPRRRLPGGGGLPRKGANRAGSSSAFSRAGSTCVSTLRDDCELQTRRVQRPGRAALQAPDSRTRSSSSTSSDGDPMSVLMATGRMTIGTTTHGVSQATRRPSPDRRRIQPARDLAARRGRLDPEVAVGRVAGGARRSDLPRPRRRARGTGLVVRDVGVDANRDRGAAEAR